MRRRFHGTKNDAGVLSLRECSPGNPCAGRMHFYAFTDDDAETLFDLLDERQRFLRDPHHAIDRRKP